MSLSYGDTSLSLDNRKNFLQAQGIDYRDLVCAKQAHGSNIRYALERDKGCGAESYASAVADTDAFITDRKNLPLAIFTADCLSIFLFDPQTPAIGLVHAGWRGTREFIFAKTLQQMRRQFGTQSQNVEVSFGPLIRGCCYEVGGEFENIFSQGLSKQEERYFLDLAGINRAQAVDMGVETANIRDAGICTACRNEEFFSFRREAGSSGRMISVMMLRGT